IVTVANGSIDNLDDLDAPPGGVPPGIVPPSLPTQDVRQSASVGYSMYRREDYTYDSSGQGSFTLHEEGTGKVNDFGSFSLGSIAYDDWGSNSYSLSQYGPGTVSGSGGVTGTSAFHDGFSAGSATNNDL